MKILVSQYATLLFDLTARKSKQEIDDMVKRFSELLRKNNQLKQTDKIIAKFSNIYNQKHNIIEVEVITVRKLENFQVCKMENYIKDKYKAKEVIIKNKIDENLKGGIVIKVGDEILDASVAGKLVRLKNILTK